MQAAPEGADTDVQPELDRHGGADRDYTSFHQPVRADPKDEASWLVGAARDALQKTEELGDDPETLIHVLQAHVLLGIAIEKMQAPS